MPLFYANFFHTDIGNSLLHLEKSFLATVAIDFGTTYSGFAFSFNKEEGEDAIFMNREWENELGHRTSKTPTCLLLKPDLSFDSFGYQAEEKYANLKSLSEEKEYMFFRHFKMLLHNDEVWSALDYKSLVCLTILFHLLSFKCSPLFFTIWYHWLLLLSSSSSSSWSSLVLS